MITAPFTYLRPGTIEEALELLGDLLVRRASAWSHEGRGEQLQFAI